MLIALIKPSMSGFIATQTNFGQGSRIKSVFLFVFRIHLALADFVAFV